MLQSLILLLHQRFLNNRIDGTSGYFNLLMAPGGQQEVSININNTTLNDITVEVTFKHSTTDQNGSAFYDEIQKKMMIA